MDCSSDSDSEYESQSKLIRVKTCHYEFARGASRNTFCSKQCESKSHFCVLHKPKSNLKNTCNYKYSLGELANTFCLQNCQTGDYFCLAHKDILLERIEGLKEIISDEYHTPTLESFVKTYKFSQPCCADRNIDFVFLRNPKDIFAVAKYDNGKMRAINDDEKLMLRSIGVTI